MKQDDRLRFVLTCVAVFFLIGALCVKLRS